MPTDLAKMQDLNRNNLNFSRKVAGLASVKQAVLEIFAIL